MGYEDIGSRIKWRRQQLDMSAADLAAKLSLSKATIHRYENGEIRNIKMPVVVSISRALKCNPAWLVGKSDNMKRGDDGSHEERYMELSNVFSDILVYLDVRQDILCKGKPFRDDDRKALEAGLNVIWAMLSSRYE